MFVIRVIIHPPLQPPQRSLYAFVVCVRKPSKPVALMKPSTVLRFAATNEVLRRRHHLVCDNTTHPGLEHHVVLVSATCKQAQAPEPRIEQERLQFTAYTRPPRLRTVGRSRGAKTTDVLASTSDTTRTTASKFTAPKCRVHYLAT